MILYIVLLRIIHNMRRGVSPYSGCFAKLLKCAVGVIVLVVPLGVTAKTTLWVGNSSCCDWETAGNWTNGLPAANDDVQLNMFVGGLSVTQLNLSTTTPSLDTLTAFDDGTWVPWHIGSTDGSGLLRVNEIVGPVVSVRRGHTFSIR